MEIQVGWLEYDSRCIGEESLGLDCRMCIDRDCSQPSVSSPQGMSVEWRVLHGSWDEVAHKFPSILPLQLTSAWPLGDARPWTWQRMRCQA